jgi:hypothetical protein
VTARESMGGNAAHLHDRLDQVLDGEDAVIVLIDRHGSTSYYHGFGISGCQLEMFGDELDRALRRRLSLARQTGVETSARVR